MRGTEHGMQGMHGMHGMQAIARNLKILALLAVVALLAAACNGDADDAPAGDAAGDADAAADGGEAMDFPDSVTIGALYPMTGAGASYGEWFSRGTEMAVEDVNAEGGIGGQTDLSVAIEDHQADASLALTLFRQFADRGVPYVMSSYTAPTLTILPVAEENGIMVVNGGGQGSDLADASENLLNTIPFLDDENVVLAEYLSDEGIETAVVIHVDDDSGESALEDFREAFEEFGGEILGSAAHEFGASDVRAQLTQLRGAGADLLYIGSHGQDALNIIEQAREVGFETEMASTSWVVIPEVRASSAAEGLIHTILTYDNPEFDERYRDAYGDDPSIYVTNYYDAVIVFAEAFRHAVENGYGTDGEAVRRSIYEIAEFEGVGGTFSFREDGTVVKPIGVARISGGESEVLRESEAE
jgi:branched-chain amino acid transport system substrate-binding protein